ncbi:hypothetical protein MKK65_26525 [Methylobacterium sp. J-001]|uniref:hypothetical protein n=1 Tax=Methylobacterium sp. J-001 TaxID=2836609 RepID=UPI001FBB15C9|nr:hypothetical protein [Methylobacterium sp. J-001]MCJ2120086.1 hypothetical protein [Methylobacterium sp. J-001]
MTTKLMDRIARLEAQQAPPTVAEISYTPGIRLLWLLLAVHVGDLQPHEAVSEGVARSLGYAKAGEMRAAMQAGGTAFIEWRSRHTVALTMLINAHGGGAAAGVTSNEEVIRSLVSSVPEKFQSYPSIADAEEAIRLVTEWVSL